MATAKIDKNVPFPPATHNKKYPWESVAVGDSFIVPGAHAHLMSSDHSVGGKTFKARKIAPGKWRVWRTK